MKNNARSSARPLPPRTRASKRRPQIPGAPLRGIRSILVTTDFSACAEAALDFAAPLARQLGAKITLLHVVEPVATPDFEMAFSLVIGRDEAAQFGEQALRREISRFELEPEILEKTLVRHGRPHVEIVSAARTLKVDLIIMATHGHTGLKHALLGSTTERVVRHAGCPVLVLPSRASTEKRNKRPSKRKELL